MKGNATFIKYGVLALAILIILEGTNGAFHLLLTSPSYSSGYEGAKAKFAGVSQGTNTKIGTGFFDTTMSWDADTAGSGKPPIAGEMTSVFVPSQSLAKQSTSLRGNDITAWLLGASGQKNPVNTYDWELKVGNETVSYRMEEWTLKWYFSISSEPTGNEVPRVYVDQPTARNSLMDVRVWFEFDIAPVWYFEGQTTAYFAIAEARLNNIQIGMKQTDGTIRKNAEERVLPMSAGSVLPIYYGLYGSEANRAEQAIYYYQGKILNPNLFRSRVYSAFTLADFGVDAWGGLWAGWFGDVVTVGVDVNVFVIGEWKVKDVQDIPTDYGRDSKTVTNTSWLGQILDAFNSPEGRLLIVAIVAVGLFLILAIFFPWVIILFMTLFGGKKGRKGG
jgi:hypothetical protein